MSASTPTRFPLAVTNAAAHDAFAHVPVHWWDQAASVWRPTVIDRRVPRPDGGVPTHVDILMAFAADREASPLAVSTARVAISSLRLASAVSTADIHFYTARYTLAMLDSLMPVINRFAHDEQEHLREMIDQLVATYTDGHDEWGARYAAGVQECDSVREGAVRSLVSGERREGARLGAVHDYTVDIYSAIEIERSTGSISCEPVAVYDEAAGRWRPTVIVGSTGDASQFLPSSTVRVMTPGAAVSVTSVNGALVAPLAMENSSLCVFAIPMLARDFLRMHDALLEAGVPAADVAVHPMLAALSRMLNGAAEEWRELWNTGLAGAPPSTRTTSLSPTLWGLTVAAHSSAIVGDGDTP